MRPVIRNMLGDKINFRAFVMAKKLLVSKLVTYVIEGNLEEGENREVTDYEK